MNADALLIGTRSSQHANGMRRGMRACARARQASGLPRMQASAAAGVAYVRAYATWRSWHKLLHFGIYVRTYVRTYLRTYVHTYVRTYVRTYARTYVRREHARIRTYVRTYVGSTHVRRENMAGGNTRSTHGTTGACLRRYGRARARARRATFRLPATLAQPSRVRKAVPATLALRTYVPGKTNERRTYVRMRFIILRTYVRTYALKQTNDVRTYVRKYVRAYVRTYVCAS